MAYPEFDTHTQNSDRWNRKCTLVAGRTNDEKVNIPIDAHRSPKLIC